MDARKVFWSEFLEIYKSLSVLWKKKSENYNNRVDRAAAYDKLVDKLKEIDPEAHRGKVIKKINNFRTVYWRELRKIKKTEKSGASADNLFESHLWYFDQLHFLADQEAYSKAKSTITDDDSGDRSNEVFEPPVKRKKVKEDEILKLASEKLRESNDVAFDLVEGWASQYAGLGDEQIFLARKICADVLFHGRMSRLTEKMVKDIHHVLKGKSSSSTPTPTSRASSTSYNEEYSHSPQPQFTFVAYQQSDETLISLPTKSRNRHNPSTDLLFTPTTHSLRSRSIITNNEEIQRSSSSPPNLKVEIEENIEEGECEDISYKVDDNDKMGSIDHEDDSHDEMNSKNLCQIPEENRATNAAKEKIETDTRRNHINWKNLNDDERREVKRLQRKRDYVCDQCGRHFTDSSNLKLHLIRHSGIKNYECEECNAKFYTAYLLKRHSIVHKSTPPKFACKYCGKTFIYNNFRLHHERLHFKERRFNCQYCDKIFFTREQQKEHELVHTRIRKHHCELCDQHFMRRTHLRTHFRSKTHKYNEQQKN